MKITFTGIGFIIGSLFGYAAHLALTMGRTTSFAVTIVNVLAVLIFFVAMSYAMSGPGAPSDPRVRLIVAIAAMPFGVGAMFAVHNLGYGLFVFAIVVTGFAHVDKQIT